MPSAAMKYLLLASYTEHTAYEQADSVSGKKQLFFSMSRIRRTPPKEAMTFWPFPPHPADYITSCPLMRSDPACPRSPCIAQSCLVLIRSVDHYGWPFSSHNISFIGLTGTVAHTISLPVPSHLSPLGPVTQAGIQLARENLQ